ncbi:MAG: GNAT family N-acetyltransferase [Acidimicrobiia bacterium]|nr:GNAT family N-acetyltransferase [Acidimicrobiia bacterium]
MIVHLHQAAFPDALLTRLGGSFLEQYYGILLANPNHIFLVASDDGKPVGFAAGFGDPSGFYALLRSRKWSVIRGLAPALIRRPSTLLAVGRNYLWARGRTSEPVGASAGELSSLAVHPGHQGQGVGARLVTAFLARALELGWSSVAVTTDEANNDGVRRFYDRLGFRVTGDVKGRTRPMVEYVKAL